MNLYESKEVRLICFFNALTPSAVPMITFVYGAGLLDTVGGYLVSPPQSRGAAALLCPAMF